MARSYSVAEARARLPTILDDVEAGEDVRLTRRGRPVAVVLSSEKYDALRSGRPGFADAYRAFVACHDLSVVGIEADFFESLRDGEPGRRVRL
jgi:prevent-host-death family protein